jgi:hypothetical protein
MHDSSTPRAEATEPRPLEVLRQQLYSLGAGGAPAQKIARRLLIRLRDVSH